MKETRNEREAERDRGIFKCLTPLPNHSLTHTAVTLLSLSLSVTTVHIIYPPLPFTISAKPKWLSSSLHFSILSLSLSINLSFPNPHFILPSISQTNLPSILFNQQATTCVCRLGSIQDLWGTSSGPSRYIYLEISKMHDRSLTKKKSVFVSDSSLCCVSSDQASFPSISASISLPTYFIPPLSPGEVTFY